MPGYDPDHKNSRIQEGHRKKYGPRKRSYKPRRLGGGGLPDTVNRRTGKFEWGRVTKPDRRS